MAGPQIGYTLTVGLQRRYGIAHQQPFDLSSGCLDALSDAAHRRGVAWLAVRLGSGEGRAGGGPGGAH